MRRVYKIIEVVFSKKIAAKQGSSSALTNKVLWTADEFDTTE